MAEFVIGKIIHEESDMSNNLVRVLQICPEDEVDEMIGSLFNSGEITQLDIDSELIFVQPRDEFAATANHLH